MVEQDLRHRQYIYTKEAQRRHMLREALTKCIGSPGGLTHHQVSFLRSVMDPGAWRREWSMVTPDKVLDLMVLHAELEAIGGSGAQDPDTCATPPTSYALAHALAGLVGDADQRHALATQIQPLLIPWVCLEPGYA